MSTAVETTEQQAMPVDKVRYVKALYPRLQPDDATIDSYRMAIDSLPPIVVARDGILVDGYHRWQAHVREGLGFIDAENLGDLTDDEIFWESVERNSGHGKQLSTADKRMIAVRRYESLQAKTAVKELAERLKVDETAVRRWTKDARAAQEAQRQADAYDLWLDCLTQVQIAAELDTPQKTISNWLSQNGQVPEMAKPPGWADDLPWGNVQHFDVWSFGTADGDSTYFGRMPPQVVENLLWFYTEPGNIVFDPFAGGGTTIDVAKRMGRRVWASDLHPSMPTLPIHTHDITTGWPDGAPGKPDLILLDPPYWQQAKGRYSDDDADMANCSLDVFRAAWSAVVKTCMEHADRIAYIISPTQLEDGTVVDHATDMLFPFIENGWRVERRIIVPYNTQQATGQQVTWARENKRLLKLYRDLVVLTK